VRANGNQGRALGLSLLKQDGDRDTVHERRARGGRDRLRVRQGRVGLVLQEIRRVRSGHARVRRLREIRYDQKEDTSMLVLEAQRLPDRDQACGRPVHAAEDAFKDRGLARLCFHGHA
jgi:hypothetical protein